MQPLPEGIRARDVEQWLESGVILTNVEGQAAPLLYYGWDGDRGQIMTRTLDGTPGPRLSKAQVFVHWPLLGMLNVPEHKMAVHAERLLTRQWARSYTPGQVRVKIPRRWDLIKATGQSLGSITSYTPEVIAAAFDPWYPTGEEALDMLYEGWHSVAISRHHCLIRIKEAVVVMRGMETAGVIDGDRYTPLDGRLKQARRIINLFHGRITL